MATPLTAIRVDVLVVDDDPVICELMSEVLRLKGYSTVEASAPEDGLALLDAGVRPRLLLLDLCMPRIDGISFYETARRLLRGHPAVLFCSGSPDARRPEAGERILLKPFDLTALLAEVSTLIGDPAPPPSTPGRGDSESMSYR